MSVLVVIAVVLGGFAGAVGGIQVMQSRIQKVRLTSLRKRMGSLSYLEARHITLDVTGYAATVLRYCVQFSSEGTQFPFDRTLQSVCSRGLAAKEDLIVQAGLDGWVSVAGIARTRASSAALLGLIGYVVGICFSDMLGILLGFVGVWVGYALVVSCLQQEAQERARAVEAQISPMIEVVVLGLKSGLSFDKALEFYCRYFSGGLSVAIENAHEQWRHGLLSRSDALRQLSRSYDSLLFSRVMENIVRSLRFGTSLADSLSLLAAEARAVRRAKLEEEIAKAPVKMLLPVGALILPAMLILVLGPILLELMQGL